MPSPVLPPCRRRPVRRTAFGLLTASAMVAVAVAVPAGAAFADPSTVDSKSTLQLDVSNASTTPTEMVLAADLTDWDTSNDSLTTPDDSDITMDLHGHSLTLTRITLGTHSTLTITDSTATDEGSSSDLEVGEGSDPANPDWTASTERGIAVGAGAALTIDAIQANVQGSTGAAGIGSPWGVTSGAGSLHVGHGAAVYATGGDGGAGVGGAEGAASIDVDVIDATLDGSGGADGAGIGTGANGASGETIAASGSAYLSGSGGSGAAGIGGGLHGSGADVTLSGTARAYADSEGADAGETGVPSVVGAGQNAGSGNTFGSLSIGPVARLTTGSDSSLVVPGGATVHNAGQIRLGGTASGAGTIENDGDIDIRGIPVDSTDDPGSRVTVTTVTGHDYAITMNPNGGTAGAYDVARVFSDEWSSQDAAEPTSPTAGQVLLQWTTNPDGSGADLESTTLSSLAGLSTGSAVPITAYAHYGVLPHTTADTMSPAGVGVAYDAALPISGELASAWIATFDENGDDIPDLPPGLHLDTDTNHITGTPTQAGTYRFRVELDTLHREPTYAWLSITIAGAPAIGTVALGGGTQGVAYSTQLAATGDGTIRWDVRDGTLPAGLALSAAGVLSGTPTGTGTSTFTVRATSEYGSTTQRLTLDVAAAPVPATPAPAASAVPAAAPVAAPVTATPVTATPVTATPVAAVPAAPALPVIPTTTVRFGHRIDLAATAASTLAVRYAVKGSLPKGVTLDPATGVLSGVVAESGTFHVTITATSTAGTASTPVTIVVPAVQDLLDAKPAPTTRMGASTTALKVGGFQKGERFQVLVDGKIVQKGTMKKGGTLKTKVPLSAGTHDVEHHIVVTGSRTVADPAKRVAAEFVVTTLAAHKKLSAEFSRTSRGTSVEAGKLAAGEQIVVRDGHRTIARGHASADGTFSFSSKKLDHGVHHLTFSGAGQHRTTSLIVKPDHS